MKSVGGQALVSRTLLYSSSCLLELDIDLYGPDAISWKGESARTEREKQQMCLAKRSSRLGVNSQGEEKSGLSS